MEISYGGDLGMFGYWGTGRANSPHMFILSVKIMFKNKAFLIVWRFRSIMGGFIAFF